MPCDRNILRLMTRSIPSSFGGLINAIQSGRRRIFFQEGQLESINVTVRFTNYFHSDQSSHARNLETNARYYQTRILRRFRFASHLVCKFFSVRRHAFLPPTLFSSHANPRQKSDNEKQRKKPKKNRSPRFVASVILASEQRRSEDYWPHGVAKAARKRLRKQ